MKAAIKLALVAIAATVAVSTVSASVLNGRWMGQLAVSPMAKLRIALNVSEADGVAKVTMDSPDQGAYGIAAECNFLSDDSLNVSVRQLGVVIAGKLNEGRMVGKFTQRGMSLPIEFEREEVEASHRPQTPKAPFLYQMKEVKITNANAGCELAGTLTMPDKPAEGKPGVVLVSGSGLQNRDEELFGHKPFAVLADALARRGIATLRYDDRGCGESSGDGKAATTADFAEDARMAVEALRNSGAVESVGIVGHSEGASVAFINAASWDCTDFVVGIGASALRGDSVLVAQSADALRDAGATEDVIKDYSEALYKLYAEITANGYPENPNEFVDGICDGWQNSQVKSQLAANITKIASVENKWLKYFAGYSPTDDVRKARCRSLVIYGSKDCQVSPQLHADVMRRNLANGTVMVVDGLNHLMQHCKTGKVTEYAEIEETMAPEVIDAIAEFILKQK